VRTKISPPELARRWGISVDKVRAWIRSGELRAVNAARRPGGRPRWLIGLEDLEAFERRRSAPRPAPARRPRDDARGVIAFF
jgi:excisionase family DNA binding protein